MSTVLADIGSALGEVERRCAEMREAGRAVAEGRPGAVVRLRQALCALRDGADHAARKLNATTSGEGEHIQDGDGGPKG